MGRFFYLGHQKQGGRKKQARKRPMCPPLYPPLVPDLRNCFYFKRNNYRAQKQPIFENRAEHVKFLSCFWIIHPQRLTFQA